jgi:hypothetical protein
MADEGSGKQGQTQKPPDPTQLRELSTLKKALDSLNPAPPAGVVAPMTNVAPTESGGSTGTGATNPPTPPRDADG